MDPEQLSDAFEDAFPGVKVEPVQLSSSDLLPPKVFQERDAGIYTFDIIIASAVIASPRRRPYLRTVGRSCSTP